MGTITEKSTWEPEVYSLERTDFIEGGVYGVDNLPHWQLANRTTWLKNTVADISSKIDNDLQTSVTSLQKQIDNLTNSTTATDLTMQDDINDLNEATKLLRSAVDVLTDTKTDLVAGSGLETDASDKVNLGIMSTTDKDNVARVYYPFTNIKNGVEDSHGFLIQPGGALVLASGEAGSTIIDHSAPATGDSEELNLAATKDINFYVNQANGFDSSSKYTFSEKQAVLPCWTVNICNKELVKGTNPDAAKTISLPLCTGDGTDTSASKRAGLVETSIGTDGLVSTSITAYKYDADSVDSASVSIVYPREGDPYTTCPNPSDSSNTNNIATTKWVSDKLANSYVTCKTAGNSKSKIVSVPGFSLKVGAHLFVSFTNMNISVSPTLNVSGTGAKGMYLSKPKGLLPVRPGNLIPGKIYTLLYNGTYWVVISPLDETITISSAETYMQDNFDNLTDAGEYLVYAELDTTKNAPINAKATWWLRVRTMYSTENSQMQVVQEARMHSSTVSSATSGVANYLIRCFDGTNWGAWEYNYSQFAN